MRSNLFCDMFIQHWKNKKNRFAAGEVRPARDSRRGFEWKRENWETQISKLLVSATAPGLSAGEAGGLAGGRRGVGGSLPRVILRPHLRRLGCVHPPAPPWGVPQDEEP